MPARQYVRQYARLTAEELNEFVGQQRLVYADHAARDAAGAAEPEQVLGRSPLFTPARDVNPADRRSVHDIAESWTVQGEGRTWTVIRVHNTLGAPRLFLDGDYTLAGVEQLAADGAEFRRQMAGQGARFRLVATANPSEFVSGPFVSAPGQRTGGRFLSLGITWAPNHAFVYVPADSTDNPIVFPLVAGSSYRYEIYIPEDPAPLRNGLLCTTLNDDKWWIRSQGSWHELQPPPPRLLVINPLAPGTEPGRLPGWEESPVAVNGREIWENTATGRMPDAGMRPFSAALSDNPVLYAGGWTHIIEDTRTVTVLSDCLLQVAAVGRGGSGEGFTPPPQSATSTASHSFGAAGGGAGGLMETTVAVNAGDTLTVNGPAGLVSVNGETIVDAPDGSQGGRGDGFGCAGGASAVNDNDPTVGTIDQPGVRVYPARGATWGGLRYSSGGRSRGAISAPGVWSARGGDGGSSGGSFGLGWAPGGIRIGGGGQGGTDRVAGSAGYGYGAGGGGSGGGLPTDVIPSNLQVHTVVTARRSGPRTFGHRLAFNATGVNVDEWRWRVFYSTTEHAATPSPSDPAWGGWNDWSTRVPTSTLSIPIRVRSVFIEVQARKRQNNGRWIPAVLVQDVHIEYADPALSVLFTPLGGNPPTRLRVRFDGDNVRWLNNTDEVNPTDGVRYQWRYDNTAWNDGDGTGNVWIPASVSSQPRYNRNRFATIVLPALGYVRIQVRAQASNANGQTSIRTFEWAPDSVAPPPSGDDISPPSTPTVNLVYNQSSGRLSASWQADRAEQYQIRWTQTNRDGTVQQGPGGADADWWNIWASSQTWSARIAPTVSQWTLEVRARNRKQTSGTYTDDNTQTSETGRASRSFAGEGPSGGVLPPAAPSVSFGRLAGTNLPVSWSAARAEEYRMTFTLVDNDGGRTVSGYSAWSTSTTATVQAGSNIRRVEVTVQARNNTAGTQPNVTPATAVWQRSSTAPVVSKAVISGVSPTPGGAVPLPGGFPAGFNLWDMTVTAEAVGATEWQRRVLSGSTVVSDWTAYGPFNTWRITAVPVPIAGKANISVQVRARNSFGASAVFTTAWNPYGTIQPPAVTFAEAADQPARGTKLTATWPAGGATEWRWQFGDTGGLYGPWTPWGNRREAELTIPDWRNHASVRVQARASSAFAHVQTQSDWTRSLSSGALTPDSPGEAPANVRLRLTAADGGWTASWSAAGPDIEFTYRLKWWFNDRDAQEPAARSAAGSRSASGGVPFGATAMQFTLVATNENDTVSVSRTLRLDPTFVIPADSRAPTGAQTAPPPPTSRRVPAVPPGPSGASGETSRQVSGQQQTSFPGGPPKAGVVVIRHSVYGQPLVVL